VPLAPLGAAGRPPVVGGADARGEGARRARGANRLERAASPVRRSQCGAAAPQHKRSRCRWQAQSRRRPPPRRPPPPPQTRCPGVRGAHANALPTEECGKPRNHERAGLQAAPPRGARGPRPAGAPRAHNSPRSPLSPDAPTQAPRGGHGGGAGGVRERRAGRWRAPRAQGARNIAAAIDGSRRPRLGAGSGGCCAGRVSRGPPAARGSPVPAARARARDAGRPSAPPIGWRARVARRAGSGVGGAAALALRHPAARCCQQCRP
jgi:hypothetical protein